MIKKTMVVAAALTAFMLNGALAADIQVKMLNKGAKGAMVFEPDFITAQVGDTVTFLPTDAGHLAETTPGMLPKGGKEFMGKAGKPVTMTIDTEGVYGVKCLPHLPMGMVAVVVAGNPVNLEDVKAAAAKIPQPKAKKKYADLLAQVGAPKAATN